LTEREFGAGKFTGEGGLTKMSGSGQGSAARQLEDKIEKKGQKY
jgi:hypothetical protein